MQLDSMRDRNFDDFDVRTPVLIVGAGPAGLTASLALSRRGIANVVVDQFPGPSHTPRAHITNQRTMEIFRDLGVEDAVQQRATPHHLMWSNAWITTMAGPEVMRSEAWGAGERHGARYRDASPCSMVNIAQHVLEPILSAAIEAAGQGELRYGHALEDFRQDDDGVIAVVREVHTGVPYLVRADYLIGADGARSRVAEILDLPFAGQMGDGSDVNVGEVTYVWIKADLARYCAHRPGTMFWQTDPHEGVTFTLVEPWNEWVAGWNRPPGVPAAAEDSPEAIRRRISGAIGDPTVEIEIKNVSRWKLNRMWALEYGRGRIWCVGDAVHRHPPMNGLGSNTSIADAYNLTWKLAMVLDGRAAPQLLGTFEVERQPVGERIVNRAWNSTIAMFGRLVPDILGITHESTPQEIVRAIEAMREDGAAGDERRAAFDRFRREELDPAFNALGIELGYRYRTGARVADGTVEPPTDGHEDVILAPTTWPGARVPHVWLEKGRRRISTLDLVGRGQFVLLTGRGGEAWYAAADEVVRRHGVRVHVVSIDSRFGFVRDPLGHWAEVRGVDSDGAVLVRPDGHVGWRATTKHDAPELPQVLGRLLALPATGRQQARNVSIEGTMAGV